MTLLYVFSFGNDFIWFLHFSPKIDGKKSGLVRSHCLNRYNYFFHSFFLSFSVLNHGNAKI